MEAWSAFVSIMAIVAIVVVAGGLIAFIGHMILGALDNGKPAVKKENKEVIDYAQYKQLENGKAFTQEKEYDFEAINESKAQKEKAMLEKEKETIFELEEDKDEELEEIENRLKNSNLEEVVLEEKEEVAEEKVKVLEEKSEVVEDEELDDFDLENMLNEISNDVIEEEKSQTEDDEIKMSDELASYSIDDLLKQVEETEVEEELFNEEVIEETAEELDQLLEEAEELESVEETEVEEVVEETVEGLDQLFEEVEPVEETEVEEELIEEKIVEEIQPVEQPNAEVEALKAQLAELNKQLELARSAKIEVVKIDVTEEECVARLEMLEERLKSVKKDYKTNAKEYRPLKKVMNDLERYQTKLRRKEAVVAKKKVALYGVNNYVDIDKEKAEKLANELELLDGLRLSVNHCEDVINANKDRFPVLEHTNQILEDQIANIEADIASTQETLQKIREKNGSGEGSNENK